LCLLAAAACAHPSRPVLAGPFAPASRAELVRAAAGTAPLRREIVRIGWRFDDGRVQVSGAGAVRIAPPDSLRADLAVRLGVARATVIEAGEDLHARPAELVERLLPDRFALWAALGVFRVPPGDFTVARLEEGARTVWRLAEPSGRATLFDLVDGALAGVSRERDGRVTEQLVLTRDRITGAVVRARLTDFARETRLDVVITGREPSDAFPAEIWRLRP
jgi:hypothetical protein